MTRRWIVGRAAALALAARAALADGQFVVELPAPFDAISAQALEARGVTLEETLPAETGAYAVLGAPDEASLRGALSALGLEGAKVSEVLFVNSPQLAGGEAARPKPRPGHRVFVVERPIPGVGFFGLERKTGISRSSNAAIAKLGDIIEWERSYLTGERTYCVYRADSPETLREHGALAGAPIGKITPVSRVRYVR